MKHEFRAVLRLQAERMFSGKKMKFAFTAMLLAVAACYVTGCLQSYGADRTALLSAASGWMGTSTGGNDIFQAFSMLLLLPLAALPFAGSQYGDRRQRVRTCLLARFSRESYLWSGALLAFAGAFLVVFVPLALSQLLAFVQYPLAGLTTNPFEGNPSSFFYDVSDAYIFPWLHYNLPYVENLIYIFYIALVGAAFAVLSYGLSQFVRRGEVIFLAGPMILTLIYSYVVVTLTHNAAYEFVGNLFPSDRVLNLSMVYWALIPVVVLALGALLVLLQQVARRDELR